MQGGRGSLQRRTLWIAAGLAASVSLLGGVAVGSTLATGGGSTGKVDFKTSEVRIETPSGNWQDVTTMDITTSGGPVVVRFDAQAYVDDYTSGGTFDGTHFSATLVRILLDGAIVSPSGVRFTRNEGKHDVLDLTGQAASFSWATTATSGAHTVKLQFRSATTFDISGFLRWTLTADHS